jgi:hypothetical protein
MATSSRPPVFETKPATEWVLANPRAARRTAPQMPSPIRRFPGFRLSLSEMFLELDEGR